MHTLTSITGAFVTNAAALRQAAVFADLDLCRDRTRSTKPVPASLTRATTHTQPPATQPLTSPPLLSGHPPSSLPSSHCAQPSSRTSMCCLFCRRNAARAVCGCGGAVRAVCCTDPGHPGPLCQRGRVSMLPPACADLVQPGAGAQCVNLFILPFFQLRMNKFIHELMHAYVRLYSLMQRTHRRCLRLRKDATTRTALGRATGTLST